MHRQLNNHSRIKQCLVFTHIKCTQVGSLGFHHHFQRCFLCLVGKVLVLWGNLFQRCTTIPWSMLLLTMIGHQCPIFPYKEMLYIISTHPRQLLPSGMTNIYIYWYDFSPQDDMIHTIMAIIYHCHSLPEIQNIDHKIWKAKNINFYTQ